MSKSYGVIGGENREFGKIYATIDGVNREITRAYVVVSGEHRLCYKNATDISVAVITLGAAQTYSGSTKTQTVASVVAEGVTLTEGVDYTVSGNTGVNAGSYSLTVTGMGDYEGTARKAWSIAKLELTKPTVSGDFTYDGSSHMCSISDMNTYITQSGKIMATNAGTYTTTFTLKNTSNTCWEDGTTDAVSRTWTIGKAAGSISVSPTSIAMLGHVGMTQTATISYTGDGAISVASNSTGVVTASISGSTITVTSAGSGSAIITITLAAGTNYTGASCTISVSNTVVGTLNNTDWSTIKTIGAAGTGSSYWSVGDRKAVAVSGTVGAASLSGTYYAYIIGFNHNSSIEGKGIHFMFGKTALSSGVDIAFCDSNYGSTGSSAGFRINKSESNSGGWSGSYMNKTICPAFLSALPSALQNAISACTKYSDNTGGGSNTASYVTSSSSKIWLPSEFEVQGARTYANSAEQNYQKQYAYYANGNSKIKYKSNDTSAACYWWLRSASTTKGTYFCMVSKTGSNAGYPAHHSYGFAPCFKVA